MNQRKQFNLTITGAAGNIGSSLIFLLVKEKIFPEDKRLILRLVDLPDKSSYLEGLKMELEDCNFENLEKVEIFVDCEKAFKNSDLIILVGAKARKPGMKRVDLLETNVLLIKKQAELINSVYDEKKQTKILVVGNPCNTLSTVFCYFAPKIHKSNVIFLSMLDQNRAVSEISRNLKISVSKIKNVIVLGNHSSTMLVDISKAYYTKKNKKNQEVKIFLANVLDSNFNNRKLQKNVKQRGGEILNKKLISSSFSASNSIVKCIKQWFFGSNGEMTSFGIFCPNLFNEFKDIFVSMPVICKNGSFETIQDYFNNFKEDNLKNFKKSLSELVYEKELAFFILKNNEIDISN